MNRVIGEVVVEFVLGDITRQNDMDAVVNAANAWLAPGGGVAGAIHRAAGPGLAEECRALAPIKPGEAVITGGHDLQNPWVIHCLGPVYGRDEPAEEILAACYRNALALAEERRLVSVGFPSISTGVFGYPMSDAAEIAVGTVMGLVRSLVTVRLVRFVLYDEPALLIHQRALEGYVS